MSELPKTYDAPAAEKRWTAFWQEQQLFRAGLRPDAETYTIMLPPPNVTGVLHMGHALNGVIQDVLARFKRMQGFDVLWMPGVDHAGIATQAVVERKLYQEEGLKREEMGREAFLDRVWQWNDEHAGAIRRQYDRLGASCDWSREAYTMDENLSRGVREAFVRLWEKDLIYRGARMVNWDCELQTAVGDDEIEDKKTHGHLWYLRYPRLDGEGYVVVATTRPETMLGDTGVAVHPDDERYRDLVGKSVRLPLMEREIPVVADDSVDPAFGTGAVKVTPGHDPADYERGARHGLPIVSILNKDGTLNENAGAYTGLDRKVARKKVVADLEALGLLDKVEDYVFNVPLSDRSKSPIEPIVSEQWFVRMEELAQPAIRAVGDGSLRIIPERHTKVYLDWLLNVRDWCISRQLWWGHRIPVWYDEDETPVASREDLELGTPHPKTGKPIVRRDPDVLDTWASSYLWPVSTLGWPDESAPDLQRYYPTQLLSTAREIIYLWVARMVMAGYEFMGQCPFSDCYIHATINDAKGRRMSKSAGNGIDPIEMIEKYGADAVRYTLMILTTEGQDVRLAETKFELGSNFMNKIWNAARFVLTSVPEGSAEAQPGDERADRWIRSRGAAAVGAVQAALLDYKFHDAAQALYRFVWDDFCDWYLESSKARLRAGDVRCGATLLQTLDTITHVLQPFAPFLSSELHEQLGGKTPLALDAWPQAGERDEAAETEFRRVQEVVKAVRKLRNENRVPEKAQVAVVVRTDAPDVLLQEQGTICALSRAASLEAGPGVERPAAAVTEVLGDAEVHLSLEGLVDLAAERERKAKELEKARGLLRSIEKKLQNEQFVTRAKPEVVELERGRLAAAQERIERLEEALRSLG
ncbi:MAG: valine--tRNA ligase [Planctomycetota bacterium]|nr:valine--tRNA ligase [Planctomycetota bacterium]